MSRNVTSAQQNAIDVRGKNVLVSAAAGSGKTAVLTQRVIELLTGDNPVSAERLVMVTFTKAASIEMKQRIEQKLADLLEQEPENALYQSQQLLLSKAKIGTIDSLCGELVRENFQTLELPANYRVAEENELQILQADVLEQVVEDRYAKGEADFLSLADSFAAKDDRRLLEVLTAVFSFIRSYPYPLDCLKRFLSMYETERPFLETDWGALVVDHVHHLLETVVSYLQYACQLVAADEAVQKKYGEPLENDLDTSIRIQNALQEGDWDRACSIAQTYEKMRLGALRGYEDKEYLERIKSLRQSGTDVLAELAEKYLITTEEELREDLTFLREKITVLFDVVAEFDRRFAVEKINRSILDFSDLEHFALRLLIRKTETTYQKTELAKSLSAFYEEIMVDECQDLNLVQNLIFWALSKGSDEIPIDSDAVLTDSQNLFLVGDVKQSIYRFRNAVPDLFVRRKKLFPDYHADSGQEPSCAKILLQNNFRSRREVTDTVNLLFGTLMTEQLGDLSYDAEEELVAGASYLEYNHAEAEIHFLNLENGSAQTEESEGTANNGQDQEAAYVAALIERMVQEGYLVQDGGRMRPCTYRDFCILLRAKKGKTQRYVDKLKERGISCYAEATNGYFDSFEISVMLDLLRVLDNPLLDIPLFSVLLSPMFGFTPDDLAAIRLPDRKAPLYLNMHLLAQEGDVQCQSFLQTFTALREQAAVLAVDRLIQRIYDQTGFLFVVESMVSGEQKRANLRLLLSYAESYEKIGYKGLDGFIRFIDRAVERGEDFSCANTVSEHADVVRILSIHGSKGLEFPICIVADCAKGFNLMDVHKPYLLNSTYGFGMNIRKPEEMKEYSNLPFEAVKLAARRETLSEEMRTLYVALTRAKEKLILVGAHEDIPKQVERIAQSVAFRGGITPFQLLQQRSYFGWLIAALCQTQSLREAFPEETSALTDSPRPSFIRCIRADGNGASQQEEAKLTFTVLPDEHIVDTLRRSLAYEYPYRELTELPAKVTVTKIAKAKQENRITDLPELSLNESGTLTGAQRGTILHSFMQYADFASAKTDLGAEINRLMKQGFLTEEEAAVLNRKKIQAFLESSLLHRMLHARRFYREYQFIYEIPAAEVNAEISAPFREEKVLMQGIADSVFEEEDGLVIVDYKTDRLVYEEDFVERYGDQLRIYREALGQYFDCPVKECLIYSLFLSKEIHVDD